LNRYTYLAKELIFRRGRSIATAVSIGVSVCAAVLLIGIATSYSQAIRVPMKTVGADVVVQRSGNIPRKLEGLVFPHPNALLPHKKIEAIRRIPGVVGLIRGVYMWELAPNPYKSILGIDSGEAGLDGLNAKLISGHKISMGDRSVLIDSDFAEKKSLKSADSILIGKEKFAITGIVDAAAGSKVIRADVYMPLRLAQELASSALHIKELYAFGTDDANLLLVKVEQRQLQGVVKAIGTLLGKKAVISSELSFQETLDSVLFLSERMGMIIAMVIGFFAIALVLRATATAVNERRRELALLQAIGWRWSRIRTQVVLENTVLALIGSAAGLTLALLVAQIMGGIEIVIDYPWDLSSTPHFLPAATLDRTQTITVPLEMQWQLLMITGFGGVLVGFAAAVIAVSLGRSQSWTQLCSE